MWLGLKEESHLLLGRGLGSDESRLVFWRKVGQMSHSVILTLLLRKRLPRRSPMLGVVPLLSRSMSRS